MSSNELCAQLLNDTGVALLPGSSFGFPEHILSARLAFVDISKLDFEEIMQNPKLIDTRKDDYTNSIKMAIFSMNNWSNYILPNK